MISFSQVRKSYRGGHEALAELSFSVALALPLGGYMLRQNLGSVTRQVKVALLAFAAVLGWLGAYMSVSRHLVEIEPK